MNLDFAFALSSSDATPFSFASDTALAAEKQVIYVGSFYQEKDDVWFDVGERDIDNWIQQFAAFYQKA